MTSSTPICSARGLHHRYGDHDALRGIDLDVQAGEVVALLGPNGSGKTTLFRLLCTLLPIQQGRIIVDGVDASANPLVVRGRIGIVFQSPSLDKKLTVDENIACQGALYGIAGPSLDSRRNELLGLFGLTPRRGDYCEKLSGGMKRQVELIKGMIHQPRLMLLDEPSVGLDPAARLNLFAAIRKLADQGMAVLMTTHLLEEADKADRVAIMADGKIIAQGTPSGLRSEMAQTVVTITSDNASHTLEVLRDEMKLDATLAHHQIRLQTETPSQLVPELMQRLGDQAESISVGRPSLEDVFVAKTGRQFREVAEVSP